MSEQDLEEIVQITVEDFDQEGRTGKISCYYLFLYYN